MNVLNLQLPVTIPQTAPLLRLVGQSASAMNVYVPKNVNIAHRGNEMECACALGTTHPLA